ncbi:MAG: alpha/beta hydrolase [Bacteroidales bacterium]|nr:alpha/beta hydrolase [Bacteroidales bacterium]
MDFKTFGNVGAPTLLLIPGLGVSYEIFMSLIRLLEERFHIIAVQVDGFTLGQNTEFTSIDDQARQVGQYIQEDIGGHLDIAYGLSLGGKILSRILERNEVVIEHAILDAAPLLPLPRWLVGPLKYLQCANVWTCCHWTGFWKWVFHSHYFDVLLDECKKVYPFGGSKAVLDGYTSVYTTKLESISGPDIHYWYGTKEAFVARPQVKHLTRLHRKITVEIFKGMNHGRLLIDRPEEVAARITQMQYEQA